jgi:pimeloyl-ACP methyl ester carboxylesterase
MYMPASCVATQVALGGIKSGLAQSNLIPYPSEYLRIGKLAMSSERINVICVHGAWADGSSWSKIIVPLLERGLSVIAAPIPLTSLTEDIAALQRVIERTQGPIVLVSHAYSGAVISGAHNARVKALVFVNSLVPDENETVADIFYRKPPHPEVPQLAPDAHGYIWMPAEGFASAFAPHATPKEISVLAAVQRPIALACIQERMKMPTWKSTPSWFLVAELDRMIDVEIQRFAASRIGATVRSYAVDHAPLITAPEHVVNIISEAVESIETLERSSALGHDPQIIA